MRYFAFPYGQHENLSADAFRVAVDAGYDGVCSAYGGYNFPGDDPFHIRRIHADPELIRLKNWLTVDPRKLEMQNDFDPGDYRADSEHDSRKGRERKDTWSKPIESHRAHRDRERKIGRKRYPLISPIRLVCSVA